jgi:transcriptional regulator with XRE-family HTH domain
MQRLGEKLYTLRKRHGLTQMQLADLLGINYNHVGKMERGERSPSLETLFKLMQVFHVSCDQLLMDDREVD